MRFLVFGMRVAVLFAHTVLAKMRRTTIDDTDRNGGDER